MMSLMVSNELITPVGVIFDPAFNYIVVQCKNDYTFVYVSQCNLVLKHESKCPSMLDEFEHVCMRLLEKGQIIPIDAIRKMEDGRLDDMSDAIEVANNIKFQQLLVDGEIERDD